MYLRLDEFKRAMATIRNDKDVHDSMSEGRKWHSKSVVAA